MVTQCISCKCTWGEFDEDDSIMSHGLCKKCVKKRLEKTIRNNQIKEGNFDCFGKSKNYCDQHNCKYREICL
jgi:hypothetical protein